MSNPRPATASKRSRSTKSAARAQRTKQSLVKSGEDNRPRSVAPTEPPPTDHNDKKQEVPIVENRAEEANQMMRGFDSGKGFDFSLATSNVETFQTKLLGMAQTNMQFTQANMQFAFEFAQRLASIRSPFEIASVIAEFTSRRMEMFRKFSQAMTELTVKRIG